MNEILTLPALTIAEMIRTKKISSAEATQTHIDRLEAVNPAINAVILPRYEAALEEANAVDKRLAGAGKKDDLPPFLGVPCTIKDCFAVEGMPWAAGIVRLKDRIAEKDATAVTRYKQAGMIMLGKTNTPESAIWYDSYNNLHGPTRNPHDLSRTVGGSSGGEGAAIAAGGTPIGLGSDGAGSIRYPSFFNGVIGHKPTGGWVPGTGHWPYAKGEAQRYFCYGPMGRTVADCHAALKVLIGPDGEDDWAIKNPQLGPLKPLDRKKLTVFYYEDNLITPLGMEVKLAVRQALEALQSAGISVIPWWPRGMRKVLSILSGMNGVSEGHDLAAQMAGEERGSVWIEYLKWMLGRSEFTLPVINAWAEQSIGHRMVAYNKKHYALGKELQREIETELGDHSVLLTAPFPTPAFKIGRAWSRFLGLTYSAMHNVLELPATVVPIRKTAKGLPVGVQIAASRGGDALTLSVAAALEEACGGWEIVTPRRG